MFHVQRLNVETGLPHEDTADFAITLNSAEMRGHWRPAVLDDAALFWECPSCGYKMHRDHYDERLTDAQNCSACEILRLHSENESLCAERDRLRERLERLADKWDAHQVDPATAECIRELRAALAERTP
jgi:DNA repair exonuclease SbcCD ATPase subunit